MNKKDLQSAKKSCFRLLKVRPRSEHELRSRLQIKGFNKEIIEQAITELSKLKFIDDVAFARLWVESRIKKPLGLKRLYFELKTKGIAKEIIEQVIAEYDSPDKEEEIIRDLVSRKIKKFSGIDKNKIKNRLFGFLIRKGFSKDIVFDVLNEIE